ncbi:MAG: hypothetical protein KQH57_01915 [Actinomycetales bacterium]|nr:hypothetical protein [Actinomycetales bacterium]
MTGSFERSARFWLRAYPPRWRRKHAEEALGVLTDLAEPEARRVGVRAALGLLLAGWAVRWRGRPPLHRWLGYRALGLRMPREYREWVADDIEGHWYGLRQGNALLMVAAGVVIARSGEGSAAVVLAPWLSGAVVVAAVQGRRGREMAREKYLVAEPGEPLLPGTYVAMGVPRPRVAARWAASRLVGLLTVCGLAATGALLGARVMVGAVPIAGKPYPATFEVGVVPAGATGLVLIGAAAALAAVGTLLAARVRRVIGGRTARLPDQPDREVRSPGWWADVSLVAVALAVSADAWAEVAGRTPLLLGPAVAVVVALALPVAVVLLRHGGALGWRAPGGAELAWADLRWVVRHDAAPPLDRPVGRVRRWDGPYVPGQVVLGPQRSDPPWPPVTA